MAEVFSFGILWMRISVACSRDKLVEISFTIKKSLYKTKDSQ